MNKIDNDNYPKDSVKKGVYILPNMLTSASLLCGFYGMISTMNGQYLPAAYAVIFSAIFDILDGKVARLTGASSRFGIEYDSLADLVAFGVSPALLVYVWALKPFNRVGLAVSFLFLICGALRLARFNVQVNTVESRKFNGLPTPGAALVVSALVIFYVNLVKHDSIVNVYLSWGREFMMVIKDYFILFLVFFLAILMVSNVKYHSFKDMDPVKRKPFSVLAIVILAFSLVVMNHEVFLFVIFGGYMLSGPILTLRDKLKPKTEVK